MDVQIISSSSKGNCYALRCDNSVLLLEAGIPVSKLREKLTARLSRVVACLVTHEHKDHAGYVQQYLDAGIPVHMSPGTRRAVGAGYVLERQGWPGDRGLYSIGGWTVIRFPVEHDAEEPVGFIIMAPDRTQVVFAVDTYLLPYKFPNINIWMLECNYELPILQENITAGAVHEAQAKRILQSHMSVDHVAAFLNTQDLSKTQAVYLLHGSDRNLNKQAAVDKIRGVVAVPVYMEGVK